MHESQHRSQPAWAHTRRTWRVADLGPTCAGAVSTVRVKVVGAAADEEAVSAQRRFDKTQSYGRVLPSFEDCIAIDNSEVDEERNVYWDVTGMFDPQEPLEPEVAFARTLPALNPQARLHESGIRRRERPRLWLQPEDRIVSPMQPVTSTGRGSGVRAAIFAFTTTAAICLTALLAAQLLFP